LKKVMTINTEYRPTALIATKLSVPGMRSAIIHRNRLTDKLDSGLAGKLTLVSAPAGFGKTTLLTDWISRISRPVAWISLDRTENDPVCFLRYLSSALKSVNDTIAQRTDILLNSAGQISIESVVINLINEIENTDSEFLLVLDDFHVVENPKVHKTVASLIDYMPEHMHLAISTRADPVLPVSRLKVRNQLTEIRYADLCFNPDETASFFRDIMGLKLADRDIAILASKTEGWIAGLQLAGMSMSGQDDIRQFIDAFAGDNRHIVDYLAEEVLSRQPELIRTFLIQTSILNRMCAELCDFVTGRDDSAQILTQLEKANLFLIPLDDKRVWYRYHHLFAELTHQKLNQTRPAGINALHLNASRWFEKQGLVEDAIEHAIVSTAFDRAAGLLERLIETKWRGGEQATLLRWLNQLPDEVTYARPAIWITKARLMFESGSPEAGGNNLDMLESDLLARKAPFEGMGAEEIRICRGKIAAVKAHWATRKGDVRSIVKYAGTAFELLPEKEAAWRAVAAMSSGIAHKIQGDMDAAIESHALAVTAARASGNIFWYLATRVWQCIDLKNAGQMPEAKKICGQLLSETKGGNLEFTVAKGHVNGVWSELLYESNRLEDAQTHARAAIEYLEAGHDSSHLGWRYTCLLKVLCSMNSPSGKEMHQLLSKVDRLGETTPIPPWITTQIKAVKAKVLMMTGQANDLAKWVADCGLDVDNDYSVLHEAENMMFARILLLQNRLDDALRVADRLTGVQEKAGRLLNLIETLIIKALILKKKKRMNRSETALIHALKLAESGGYIRVFVDEGPPLAEFIDAIDRFDDKSVKRFAKKLSVAFKSSGHANRQDGLIEELSSRELDVLRLICKGRSNKQISAALFISANTVKTHLKNIYGKLSVHSRSEAILKTQELDLL